MSGRKKTRESKEENVTLGPTSNLSGSDLRKKSKADVGLVVLLSTRLLASCRMAAMAETVVVSREGGTEVATCNHLCPSVVTAVVGVGKRR
ncbi:hypothetical protein ZIOFF_028836 [Zingiber officinale]|uniref:Uncharacterized protein n=1 Tax=Zingiber officinale TaxID=94328 RepID=A0A8J5GNM4_ZINOF|nr:hypothetical protein ZIOFF_028836 [Zingiber officinale]